MNTDLIRIEARDAVAGDEIIVGPQGRIPEAPTVLSVAPGQGPDGPIIVATLIDEDNGAAEALWLPDTLLTILRRPT